VLEGIRIIDLTWAVAGPYATMLLGDLGAEVIKIEHPAGDPTRLAGVHYIGESSTVYYAFNRNKRGVILNLQTDAGKDAFRRLIRSADVVVENFRAGTLARMGFDARTLAELRPGLIHCSVSGLGHSGPFSDWGANDLTGQAMGGVIAQNGPGDGTDHSFPTGVAVSDLSTALNACISILAALASRRSNEPRGITQIDLSLLSSTVSLLSMEAAGYLNAGAVPGPHGGAYSEGFPLEAFPTADGRFAIAVAGGPQWPEFCTLIGCDDLAADETLQDGAERFRRKHELRPIIAAATKKRTTQEWLDMLLPKGFSAYPVLRMDEVFAHPQVQHLGLAVETEKADGEAPVRLADSAWNFSDPTGDWEWRKPRSRPPRPGEHTRDVLREAGYTDDEVDALLESGAAMELPSREDMVARMAEKARTRRPQASEPTEAKG
jgi:crotonobetainyl-CoA:carnitine CoA-transferase CaiB-like acyl-CoA transferase